MTDKPSPAVFQPGPHPIIQRPVLHCGVCRSPLVLPRKVALNGSIAMEDGQQVDSVLAECNLCCVAVIVPVSAIQPLPPISVEKVEARPWPKPKF
jgi:hypothetical protein